MAKPTKMVPKIRKRVLSWISKGKDTNWIAKKMKLRRQQVAAVRAHQTQGRYD